MRRRAQFCLFLIGHRTHMCSSCRKARVSRRVSCHVMCWLGMCTLLALLHQRVSGHMGNACEAADETHTSGTWTGAPCPG